MTEPPTPPNPSTPPTPDEPTRPSTLPEPTQPTQPSQPGQPTQIGATFREQIPPMPDVPTTAQFYPPSSPPSQSVPQPPVYPFPQPGRAAPPTVPFQPPPPYMVYQQPPRPPSSNKNLLWLLLIPAGIIVLCVSCLGIGIVGAALSPSATPTVGSVNNANVTPTGVVDIGTFPPSPTAEPPGPPAILGSITYGTNSDYEYSYITSLNNILVHVETTTRVGKDGESYIDTELITPQTGTSMNKLFTAVSRTLLPADAVLVQGVVFTDGTGTVGAIEQSAKLASVFPSYDFRDNTSGGFAPAGTFEILCIPNDPSVTDPNVSLVSDCQLQIGVE